MSAPLPGNTPTGRLPITGVRVLDLTDEAVVLAPRLLADLGAQVIRIEDSISDSVRARAPFVDNQPGPERSLAHLLYNAGKQSVALALDRDESWPLVERLTRAVDVVIAPLNPSPPIVRLLDDVRARTGEGGPGLVRTVFRRGSPQTAVTDLIGVAAGGLLILNGYKEDPPNQPAGQLAYKQCALAAATAAMALITARRHTGIAGDVEVSIQEAVMLTTAQTGNPNYWHWHQTRPGRNGIGGTGGRSIFQTADGNWVSFTIPPPFWPAYADWLATALGHTAFLADEWRDPRYRLPRAAEVSEQTARLCASLPREQLLAEGQRRRLLLTPVNSVAGIAVDPHLRERGFFQPVEYPQFGRTLDLPRSPFLSSAHATVAVRAPLLGEHSASVLETVAGLSPVEVARLIDAGVVHAAQPVTT